MFTFLRSIFLVSSMHCLDNSDSSVFKILRSRNSASDGRSLNFLQNRMISKWVLEEKGLAKIEMDMRIDLWSETKNAVRKQRDNQRGVTGQKVQILQVPIGRIIKEQIPQRRGNSQRWRHFASADNC
jgi:hypothetical protein